MDIGIAKLRKSEKNIGGGESNIERAELSIGGGRGPPQKYTNWHQCLLAKPVKENDENTFYDLCLTHKSFI